MFTRATWLAALFSLLSSTTLMAAGQYGEPAPQFPPGTFSDGNQYDLSDFEGKVLVLFFYEQKCPTLRASIPARNELVKTYAGKPVKFIAIAAGDTLQQAKAFAGATKLAMPVFADSLSLMESSYGQKISLENIHQTRVIGPDGTVVGYGQDGIDRGLEQVKLKYELADYHAKVQPAVELLEWNQYAAGMKKLKLLLKNGDKAVAESAQKLQAALEAEGEQWLTEAAEVSDADPVKAFDLYTKVPAVFGATHELSKKASEALKSLKSNKAVADELAARKMYAKMMAAIANATPQQKAEVGKFAASIVKKYPGTPTAEKAEQLKKDLGA